MSSYSLIEPEIILKKVFNLLMSKIIKPRDTPESLEKIKKHGLYFMIENLPNREEILSYEIDEKNTESL